MWFFPVWYFKVHSIVCSAHHGCKKKYFRNRSLSVSLKATGSLTSFISKVFLPSELRTAVQWMFLFFHTILCKLCVKISGSQQLSHLALTTIAQWKSRRSHFLLFWYWVNINCSSWLLPVWFYALCFYHIIG